jgi:UDP-glucose 4-epimerase
MKVLITGGAGFIGSHLADALLARGDSVVIVDNLATGQLRNVPEGAEFHNITLGDEPVSAESDILLALPWKDIDVVVHAAASYKDPNDWHRDALTNCVGTADLLRAMKTKGKNRIIYFQTALVYGLKPPPHPIQIDQPQSPIGSSYAATKTAAENLIASSGLDFVSFRLANCYGPRNVSGPVPTFYKRLREGEPCTIIDTRRDFVFVSDLVAVVLKAIDGTGHGYYHVSSGKDARIADVYFAVCEAFEMVCGEVKTGAPFTLRGRTPDDVETILLDPSKTEQEFGWRASVLLRNGVLAAVQYYNEFGVGETFTHLALKG